MEWMFVYHNGRRKVNIHNNCKKKVKRLWISSVTDKAIKDGFKNLKAGLCLIIGGAILAALVYYGFYSGETIPWLKQWIILLWLIGGLPCYIGIYLIDKEKNKQNPLAFFIRTICFFLALYAVAN